MAYVLNPFTGELTPSVSEALSAKVLILEKNANESISALSLVYLDTSLTCRNADNLIYNTSICVGIALNGGAIGDLIKILSFGIVEDPFFIFGLNDPIYLGLNGVITDIAPTSGILVKIGNGLGDVS